MEQSLRYILVGMLVISSSKQSVFVISAHLREWRGPVKSILFRNSVIWFSLFAVVLGLAANFHVAAQVISGDLVGTVLDKTGAAIPGARVEATKVDTGVKYETTGGENGEYRIPNLPIGVYSITASAPNFASTAINGYTIQLNKISSLTITLEVKGAVTSIEVSGSAATLDTTT